jgi:hypothetical protein
MKQTKNKKENTLIPKTITIHSSKKSEINSYYNILNQTDSAMFIYFCCDLFFQGITLFSDFFTKTYLKKDIISKTLII